MRIVIDPGHGGSDPGAIGPSGVREASAALILAMHLYPLLALPGRRVDLTRWADVDLPLWDRVEMARGADLFISLHLNAAADPQAHGAEVLYHPSSERGKELAGWIQGRLLQALGLRDRGIKPRPDLYVLRETTCPAVLVEVAFLSNPSEEKLFDPRGPLNRYRDAAAAIAGGVEAWQESQQWRRR